uniref:Uncharacterized protein n=1 Tax=Mustela putorius furo TaxID=9669 RepID=M3YBX3_MUSPF
MKNKIREKHPVLITCWSSRGAHAGEGCGAQLRRPRRGEPLPEAPVECPERWSAPRAGGCLILEPHSRIRGGGERLGRGRGRKEGYKGRGPGGREPGRPWRMSPGRSDRLPAAAQSLGTPWTAGPALCWSRPRTCWWPPSTSSCWRWCWGPSCYPLSLCSASASSATPSSCAPRHLLAPRTCGTRASRPCWSPDSCSSCRCSC